MFQIIAELERERALLAKGRVWDDLAVGDRRCRLARVDRDQPRETFVECVAEPRKAGSLTCLLGRRALLLGVQVCSDGGRVLARRVPGDAAPLIPT